MRNLGPQGAPGDVPDVDPGRVVSGSFESRARLGARCGWSIGYPPGDAKRLSVVVVLHGRGVGHREAFQDDYLALGRFLAQAVGDGAPPFAYASVDGGDTYWHRRASGEDAAAMVADEFLPLLADRGLDVSRVGLLGWSMGGYGSLRLAARLGPGRVAAVAAESPALWRRYPDSAPGAFDDEADFTRNAVLGRQRDLAGIPVRIDCGQSDPFYAVSRRYVRGFPRPPGGGFQPGGHNPGYWRRMAPEQTRFLARALSAAR
jgi:dienelactone hydrolase